MNAKSTVEEIRQRFDNDVERFSNLEAGQTAAIDSPLMLDLVGEAAQAVTPHAKSLLDIGCGAGNYTLKLLQRFPNSDCTLLDLSQPMLERAKDRISAAGARSVETIQGDVREVDLGVDRFDVIVAAMTLHHLRTHAEWQSVFAAIHRSLRPGGSFWIVDHIRQAIPALQDRMQDGWGRYLIGLGGEAYRDKVFAYTEKEDTPETLIFQLETLRQAGFSGVDVLHKTNLFAAFGGLK